MEDSVVIKNISKSFGHVKALSDVSLNIKPAEMFAVMGADGSGRTTLFRLMTSLAVPDAGSISVCGFDTVSQYEKVRKCIGYMPGRFSLYGDLTVEENLNFFAALFDVDPKDNRYLIDDIYSQIEPFKNRKAAKLSGGMKQKLALCCALIHAPKVLFLDEPTTGIDPVSRKELWQMLKKLSQRGITIIASTPYLNEVRMCSRAALLESGVVTRVDSASVIADMFEGRLEQRDSHTIFQRDVIIDVRNLTKRFGDFTAVNNISFSVHSGEIFGFLGANGAGKTTAMRILCGLSLPSGGSGTIMGYDMNWDCELIKEHIGYMSQKFALYNDLTVMENLQLFAGIYKVPKEDIDSRCLSLLDQMHFLDKKDRMVGTLPLGWKQRLAFVTALVHNPKVVFLDEPTGGVDPIARRDFWEIIYRQAAERDTTFFVTTHYMDEAEYCDRISIMVDGCIEAMDTPSNLCTKYSATNIDAVFHQLARKAQRQDI